MAYSTFTIGLALMAIGATMVVSGICIKKYYGKSRNFSKITHEEIMATINEFEGNSEDGSEKPTIKCRG